MDKIAVLDFGGQYAHLIANRIRRLGVYTEILDPETEYEKFLDYKGIVLSGGPASVRGEKSLKCDRRVFEIGVPVLGICYGHQLTAFLLGGEVEKGAVREYGSANVKFFTKEEIFNGVEKNETVWMSHFDQVVKIPEGFEVVASSKDCEIAAMMDKKRKIFTVQFHPEVTHTPCGKIILQNFVNMTNAKREWNIDNYIEEIIQEIREKSEGKKVFLLVSGGVDSTVAFLLLDKAIGQERVYGLFVDIGLMRFNERKEVEQALKEIGVKNLHVYDASEEFFSALKEVYDPEEKRKIIGDLFLDIQQKVSDELNLNPNEWLLAQGTIYPDTIETGGTKHADTIKTHHNRVERIQKLIDAGKVLEPLAQLYKDEVRLVGERLKLGESLIWRHPFPGPGLAVRTLCAQGPDLPENFHDLEGKMNGITKDRDLQAKILPIKSVGVQGDERTYRHPAALFGEAESWDDLNKISTRLTNQFAEINRVVWALNPAIIEDLTTQNSYINPGRISIIQRADRIVMDFIKEAKIDRDIWQFPTVLIPVGKEGRPESIVLRPVCSQEAMTADFYKMDFDLLNELVKRLMTLEGVFGIFYDITNKPPGTIEWE